MVPPELRVWCHELHTGLYSLARARLNSTMARRKQWWRLESLARTARSWILVNMVVIYGDKRGHVTLTPPHLFVAAHQRWLAAPRYVKHFADSFSSDW